MTDSSAVTERWLPVVGWESCYEVSDQGRVRSVDRVVVHRDGSIHKYAGQDVMVGPNSMDRHLHVNLWRNSHLSRIGVHRLVALAFIGPCPSGMECCHKDDNPVNNVVENLRWDTPSGNMYDRVKLGTHYWANKTQCPSSHLLVVPNLLPSCLAKGERKCRACHNARSTVSRAAQRGHPIDFRDTADGLYARIMKAEGERHVA